MTGQMDAILDTMQGADEVKAAAMAAVHNAVAAIFADLSYVNMIAVDGHTPYFNDGDMCEWGINTQVDWLGDAYWAPEEERAKLTSEVDPGYETRSMHPHHNDLMKALQLLNMFEREFNIMDEANGTWWMFIRHESAENGFRIETGEFEHD